MWSAGTATHLDVLSKLPAPHAAPVLLLLQAQGQLPCSTCALLLMLPESVGMLASGNMPVKQATLLQGGKRPAHWQAVPKLSIFAGSCAASAAGKDCCRQQTPA